MDLNLSVLRKEAKKYRREGVRIFNRILVLIELAKKLKFRRSQGRKKLMEIDFEIVSQSLKISSRTARRYLKLYEAGGVEALKPVPALGKKASAIRGHVAKKITLWRRKYNWGAEVISAHLKHDHGIETGEFRINRFLRRKGLLEKRKKFKKKKKHTRVVIVEKPGVHTQTDVKYQLNLLANGKKAYVYNFVDHASRWQFKRAFDCFGPYETKQFVSELLEKVPFDILRLQSDNGVEFTFKYVSTCDDPKTHDLDLLCADKGIRHVLIPPGEKELQGLVERSHRQDDEELYHRISPDNLEEFNWLLDEHCKWANSKRRRKALKWKTANEFLKEFERKNEIENLQQNQVKETQKMTEENNKIVKAAA